MFHIDFRNEQGVLMRILTAVSRRGLGFEFVYAKGGYLNLQIEVTDKQKDQLLREWRGIVGVENVDENYTMSQANGL